MSAMLASVNSLNEALLLQQAQVDIIDLKQPKYGALGALDVETVKKIVTEINQKTPISATIGDLPMQPELIFNAVQTMAATGVEYVKIGFFPEGDSLAVIDKLASLTSQGLSLIAVLFADTQPDFTLIQPLKTAGFRGVMLDTLQKKNGSLTQIMPVADIQNFVELTHGLSLLCGLAGSLRHEDIEILLPLNADYLGFRGALCHQHERIGQLDITAVQAIKQAMS